VIYRFYRFLSIYVIYRFCRIHFKIILYNDKTRILLLVMKVFYSQLVLVRMLNNNDYKNNSNPYLPFISCESRSFIFVDLEFVKKRKLLMLLILYLIIMSSLPFEMFDLIALFVFCCGLLELCMAELLLVFLLWIYKALLVCFSSFFFQLACIQLEDMLHCIFFACPIT